MGQRLLEPGVQRLEPDRAAAPDRRRAEPVARARLLPLRQRRRRRVPARSGPHPARALSRPLDHPQLHDALLRVRPLHERRAARFRLVGFLSRPGKSSAGRSADEEKVRWARTGHPDIISFNHDLYRGLKGRARLLGDGAGQRPGQLGALQRRAGRRRGRALDGAGLGPRRKLRLLLPLAGGDDRAGADALRAAAPRRDGRSRR